MSMITIRNLQFQYDAAPEINALYGIDFGSVEFLLNFKAALLFFFLCTDAAVCSNA